MPDDAMEAGLPAQPQQPGGEVVEAATRAMPRLRALAAEARGQYPGDAEALDAAIAALSTLRPQPDARAAALEEAARLIEGYQPAYGSDTVTMRPRIDGNREGLPYAAAIRALSATPAVPAATEDAGAGRWQELNPEHSVYAWEADIVLLWHRLWDRGVTAGYYDQATDQWRGLDETGWFAVGIPPSHYMLFPAPPPGAAPSPAEGEGGHG